MKVRAQAAIVATTGAAAIAVALTVPQLASASGEDSASNAHAGAGHGGAGVVPTKEMETPIEGPVRVGLAGGDVRLIRTRIAVAKGSETPWHFHPGPHIVMIESGDAVVFNRDCSIRGTYAGGSAFFDPGWASAKPRKAVHTLRAKSDVVLLVVDLRDGGKPPTVPVDPQPAICK